MPSATVDFSACDSVLAPDALLLRYDEIAMKGRNRSRFERLLVRRARAQVDELAALTFERERGRIWALRAGGGALGAQVLHAVRDNAHRVFGLSSISPGVRVEPSLEALDGCVDRVFPVLYQRCAAQLAEDAPVRYAMRMRRHGGGFGMKSQAVEIHVADRLLAKYPRLKVDLADPDLRLEVEVRPGRAFLSWERVPGPGGLPVGCSGTALALVSGGIDSPVACRQMMKRGCRLHYVTFHSAPYTPPETVEKVARLVRVLNRYQDPGRLFAVNLLPFQKRVRDHCQEKFRTLMYRRMMMRIACWIADRMHAGSLVTGDCLGQVASQTLRNLNTVERAADRLVLRPLISFDKKESIAIARGTGTLDISNENVPDSCTVFAPASPATGAHPHQLEHEEQRLLAAWAAERRGDDTDKEDDFLMLMQACFRESAEIDVESGRESPFMEAIPPPSPAKPTTLR